MLSLFHVHFGGYTFFARVGFRNRSKDQFKSNSLKFLSEAFGFRHKPAFSSSYHYLILNIRLAHVRFVNHTIP